MRVRKPGSVKLLLLSCWISCAISSIFLLGFGLQVMTAGNKSVTDTILTAVFFAVFLIHPSDVIYLVRKFYPASEIYGVHWNIYRIIVALAMLELSLIILGASVILATEDVGEFINQPHNPAVLIAFTLVSILILSQIHIVFAGLRNINTIRKNYRSQLLDSI